MLLVGGIIASVALMVSACGGSGGSDPDDSYPVTNSVAEQMLWSQCAAKWGGSNPGLTLLPTGYVVKSPVSSSTGELKVPAANVNDPNPNSPTIIGYVNCYLLPGGKVDAVVAP